jgi:formylglycine-generating enzyme required for sulfatase activity
MALGGFDERALPKENRLSLPWLRGVYQTHGSAAVHAAAGWLLTRWGEPLPAATAAGEWRTNSLGMTMVRIPGPVEFTMGAPPTERGTQERYEKQHRAVIGYSYEVAATEVTVGQFRRFLVARNRSADHLGSDADLAVRNVTWFDAVAFCNWLSEEEGCKDDDLCYRPNADGHYADGMSVVAGFRTKKGYRLPTDVEWEYACRAGTTTCRSYGDADELLPRYAWFNTLDGPAAVGQLLPNAFGLFDMHGNESEWCHDRFREYPGRIDDQPDAETVSKLDLRTVRSGKPASYAIAIRSARRYSDRPSLPDGGGFRVARGVP